MKTKRTKYTITVEYLTEVLQLPGNMLITGGEFDAKKNCVVLYIQEPVWNDKDATPEGAEPPALAHSVIYPTSDGGHKLL